MDFNKKLVQEQYVGCLQTPFLWGDCTLLGMKQLQIEPQETLVFEGSFSQDLRLGKRVEQFVSHKLRHLPDVEILSEQLQIQHNQRTVGEIDMLLNFKGQLTHLEIVYKFYLFHPELDATELNSWIGPNQRDNLVYKLEKLSKKQLPLLYRLETQKYLDKLNLNAVDFVQNVWFQAQLFVPIDFDASVLKLVNQSVSQEFI